MPIIGLTDRVEGRLMEVGRLRKGGERDAQGHVGKDLSYFRFTSQFPEAVAAFEAAFKKEPKSIEVFLPYETIDQNFPTWKEAWASGKGLLHRCDGVTQVLWLGADNKYHREPKPCSGGCVEVGRLHVIIPALVRAGYVGYVTLQTGGTYDILNILGALHDVVQRRGSEDLTGIGFALFRYETEIGYTDPKTNEKKKRKAHLVTLMPARRWVQAQLNSAEARALLPPGATVTETPSVIDESTGEIIEAESEVIDAVDGPAEETVWQDDAGKVALFKARAKELGLSGKEVLHRLGDVHSAGHFEGSFDEAMLRLETEPIAAKEEELSF